MILILTYECRQKCVTAFPAANLIRAVVLNDPDKMQMNILRLVWMVIQDIFAIQPVTLQKLDDYTVMLQPIFEGNSLQNECLLSELPPRILTTTLDSKRKETTSFQKGKRRDQLD